jgi:hypothetical protein
MDGYQKPYYAYSFFWIKTSNSRGEVWYRKHTRICVDTYNNLRGEG